MLGAPCGLIPVCIPVDLSSHGLQKRIRALSHRWTHGAAGMFENTSTSVLESTGNETNQKSSQKSKSSWTQIKRRCGTVVGERFLNHQNNIQAIHWYSLVFTTRRRCERRLFFRTDTDGNNCWHAKEILEQKEIEPPEMGEREGKGRQGPPSYEGGNES